MRLYEIEVLANGSWRTWTVWATHKEAAFAAIRAAHPSVDFNEHTWNVDEVSAYIVKTPSTFLVQGATKEGS